MANLVETRRRFRIIATTLGAIAVIAALVAFLPWRPSAEQKEAELNEAKLESKRLETEVGPLRDLPHKLVQARADIQKFYQERFPDHFSMIPETLGKIAADNDVQLSDVKYETRTAEAQMPGLQSVSMEAVLSGDYADVVRFINALERSHTFFLIERVSLGEEGKGGGDVRLTITLSSIMRTPKAGQAVNAAQVVKQ